MTSHPVRLFPAVRHAVAVVLLLAGAGGAAAQTFTWTGASGTAWSTAADWSAGSGFPNATDAIADLIKSLAANTTVAVTDSTGKVGALELQDTSGANKSWTVGGSSATSNTLTFATSSGNPTIKSDTGANTINAALAVANGSLDVTVTGTSLTIGAYTVSAAGQGIVLNAASTGTLILNKNTAASGGVFKADTLTVNGGTLEAVNFIPLTGDHTTYSTVTIGAAGTFWLNGGQQQFFSSLSGTGTLLIGGTSNFSLGITGAGTFAGQVTGSGKFQLSATSAAIGLTLSGNNDAFTGQTLVAMGKLIASGGHALGDTSAVSLSASQTLDISPAGSSETIGSLASALAADTGASVLLGANTLTTGGNNSSTAFTGAVGGAGGSLVKQGTGTMTLSGANTYTGTTDVRGGLLLVTGTHTGGGAYTVESGARLGGHGTIAASGIAVNAGGGLNLSNGGAIAPGTLTLALGTNSLDLSAMATGGSGALAFSLGTSSDKVLLTGNGTLNLGGGLLGFGDFSFLQGAGFDVGSYVLFDTSSAGGIVGSLGSTLSGSIGAYLGTLSLGTDGGGNADLVLNVAAVPEPSAALSLLGGGILLLLGKRARRLLSR